MRHIIRLSDFTKEEVMKIFHIADEIKQGKYKKYLQGKTVIMFFPSSSIRTKVTFEKGIYLLGGQSILFTPDTLDKKEEIRDVVGYLNNWADLFIVRHKDIHILDQMMAHAKIPIINAMTDRNHPCEMISDLYALSKIRNDFINDKFLFVGAAGNIGYAWKEASELMGFSLEQSCPVGYEIEGLVTKSDLDVVILNKDIICTDSLSSDKIEDFKNSQVTLSRMKKANENAVLNPCPPFYRGEEVAGEVIDSSYFVGYHFKEALLEVQQAIIIFLMKEVAKKKQEKELFDSMQALQKVVDQYVRREDETYQRIVDVLPDADQSKKSQENVTVEQKIPKDSTLDTVNSFFESSSEINVKPSKHSETVEHYDSYITENYAKTAIEAEKDAVKEMEEVSRPSDWREEFADYKKLHPEMDVEEMIDSFDDYYNGLWDKYNAQNINREIRTRGR